MGKKCLRDQDRTVEYRDIIATDEVFEALTNEQMEVLHERDILQYIIENKRKSFVNNRIFWDLLFWFYFLLSKFELNFDFLAKLLNNYLLVCFGKFEALWQFYAITVTVKI